MSTHGGYVTRSCSSFALIMWFVYFLCTKTGKDKLL